MAHICPTIEASAITPKHREIIRHCRKHGVSIHRLHRDGPACRLSGPGVDLTVCDLSSVTLHDLEPATQVRR